MRIALAVLALAACGSNKADKEQALHRTEAQLKLKQLGKDLKVEYIANMTFPVGKAGPLPPEPCCKGVDHRCAVTSAWQNDKIWNDLDFAVLEPGYFQYSYESDGKTATVKAVGDLDCDGTPITFTLRVTSQNDAPQMTIDEPPADAD